MNWTKDTHGTAIRFLLAKQKKMKRFNYKLAADYLSVAKIKEEIQV